ncbi:MAG: carboxyl transferase domain-containing protein [Chloroflexota bacterium]|nr:carboxyl transferase domain-containing protein [Chloroflexota bacterium]
MNDRDNNFIELGEDLSNCLNCNENISSTDFYKSYKTCPFCNFHYSINFKKRIEIVCDKGSFKEINKNISIIKPVDLELNKSYKKKVRSTRNRTGLEEAAISGICSIGGIDSLIIILDFGFLGGSMGLIVGDKISKSFAYASKHKLPVVSIISSGGKRIQEGLHSLSQMVKTVIASNDLLKNNVPHISLYTNPSGGQVYSSFASRANIKLAEPGSIIGMSPLQEIIDVTKNKNSINVTAENFYNKGLINRIIPRDKLKIELYTILEILTSKNKIPKETNLSLPRHVENNLKNIYKEKSRPTSSYYMKNVFDDFLSLSNSNEEKGIIDFGLAKITSQPTIIIGQNYNRNNKKQDGKLSNKDLLESIKAIKLANTFNLPIISFIDNTGINKSFENEIGGIGPNISKLIDKFINFNNFHISIIIGEAGGEAALPYTIADSLFMLEHSIFWAGDIVEKKSNNEKISAKKALESKIVDAVIPEPPFGASKSPEDMSRILKIYIINTFSVLNYTNKKKIISNRLNKFAPSYYDKKLISTVTNEVKIWRNVLEASYKALRK